jgi:phosphate transport system protein
VSKLIDELGFLKNRLLEMVALVEAGIELSVCAVTERKPGAVMEVFRNEKRINSIELEIDALAIDLLALQQPMASNLRFIIAALKINSNLERMGDLSVNIAHCATSLIEGPAIAPIIDIPLLAGLVQTMTRNSMDAFVARDVDLAETVLASDDAVDSLRTTCFHQVVSFMKEDPTGIRQALHLLNVARNLERLADHSTNIAEDVVFYVKGIDVRHRSTLEQLNERHR